MTKCFTNAWKLSVIQDNYAALLPKSQKRYLNIDQSIKFGTMTVPVPIIRLWTSSRRSISSK